MIYRNGIGNGHEVFMSKTVRVTGTGALAANILQVFGSVRIIEQFAVLKSITSLINATNVYADAYDGTNTELLTSDGAVLSGVSVGSLFTKDKDNTNIYSVSDASQVRVNEVLADKNVGKPFTVTQKNGADTFIRFHLTTTDTPVDFMMEVVFIFERHGSGSNLVFL